MRHDLVSTFLRPAAEVAAAEVAAEYAVLAGQARARLSDQGVPLERVEVQYAMDLRFVGQTHELTMQLPGPHDTSTHAALPRMFGDLHQRVFGHAPEHEEPVEIVNLRVAGIGRLDRPEFPELPPGNGALPRGQRPVFFGGQWMPTAVWRREDLRRGDRLEGPAVVEQLDSTTVLPPGWRAEPDRVGSLILRRTQPMTPGPDQTGAHT
jgi:N-methylhydantoinase A